jgi:hypothetical protein
VVATSRRITLILRAFFCSWLSARPGDAAVSNSSQKITPAKRAAAMYKLIGMVKLNGVDSQAYLRQMLTASGKASKNRWRGMSLLCHGRQTARQAHTLFMESKGAQCLGWVPGLASRRAARRRFILSPAAFEPVPPSAMFDCFRVRQIGGAHEPPDTRTCLTARQSVGIELNA